MRVRMSTFVCASAWQNLYARAHAKNLYALAHAKNLDARAHAKIWMRVRMP
jgi:hypothetical protein